MSLLQCVVLCAVSGVSYLQQAVQAKVDQFSEEHYGHAVVVSFKNSTDEWSVAAGYRNFRDVDRVKAEAEDGFLFGSVTKLYTAVAIMKLVEDGLLDLDEPAYPYIDRYLADNGTSMASLYGLEANNITIAHLLSMRSGLREYDTPDLRDWQLSHPTTDFTPIDIVNYLPDKTLRCAPGTCGAYSSIQFTLLGFVLASFANATTWDAYDQRTPFAALLHFPLHGTLADQQQLVPLPLKNLTHGYIEKSWTDVWNVSALAGWTCGNILSNTPTQNEFVYSLFSNTTSSLLSDNTVRQMLNFQYLKSSVSWTGAYGYGVQALPQSTEATGRYYGHGGETYGFETSVGYNEKLDFALSIATNMESAAGWHLGTMHTDIYKAIVMDICGAQCQDEVSIGCSDQVGFVDEGGAACEDWEGYNCTTAVEDYEYTQLGTDMLVAHCPVVCEDVPCPPADDPKPYAVYAAGGGYYYHSRLTFRGFGDMDIGRSGGTIEDCIAACDANPDCNHFLATVSGVLDCVLRTRCVFPTDYLVPPAVSSFLGVPYRTYFKPCIEGAVEKGVVDMWHTGQYSFPVGEYNLVTKNVTGVTREECRELCRSDGQCKTYTMHYGHGTNVCYLSVLGITPATVLAHQYSPLNGSVVGVCAGASCVAPGVFRISLEECILRCEQTKFTPTNASCKAINYNKDTYECFLHQGAVSKTDQLYNDGKWFTWMKEYEYAQRIYQTPILPEGSHLASSTQGALVSEGWCTDWCNTYHYHTPTPPKCLTMVYYYNNFSCAIYSTLPEGYTFTERVNTWVHVGKKESYWKDQSPVGCCTTMEGMFEGLTADECGLLSNRRVYREGKHCNLSVPSPLPTTEVPVIDEETPAPVVTVVPAATPMPTTGNPLPPVMTAVPDVAVETVEPVGVATLVPTPSPSGGSSSYKLPFFIACVTLFVMVFALIGLANFYAKRRVGTAPNRRSLNTTDKEENEANEHLTTEMSMLPDAVDDIAA
eukprot:TRINITY_DN5863_c0_g2_i1.p1 TRINITY_DN5863_c0_g2~~TRINITY_DN5863_c0_g2_i1.p1  ORF type:complete len:1027 (+),score=216.67 TRINITY_DN5863_c0_g2_i1:122-3082(+)